MDYQVILNGAFGVISFLGGWLLKTTYAQINRLQEDYDELYEHHEDDLKEVRKEMSQLALSMPEKYVSKQDMDKLEDFINERFNKLEAKLDQLKP